MRFGPATLSAPKINLVLGGDGWTLRDYCRSGGLARHVVHAGIVRVVTLDAFTRIANNGEL